MYFTYSIGYSGHSGGPDKISEEEFNGYYMTLSFSLWDNITAIDEAWGDAESKIINMMNNYTTHRPKR